MQNSNRTLLTLSI